MKRMITRALCCLLATLIVVFSTPVPKAHAGLVSTEAAQVEARGVEARARLGGFLDRDDVRLALEARGIDPAEARARVDALSDAEVQAIAGRLDELPAGGNGVVGAILLVFFVLLITDLLGLTHVFPFVNHPARR
jgi:hypothetical protein